MTRDTTPTRTSPARAGVREWAGLGVLAMAVLLIAVDATVLDVAVPFISESLRPTSSQLLWIIDVYSFVLAGLLVTMGTLGDRIGRRRLLLLGAAGFGAASVLAAFSTGPGMLIAARVLQGVAGATLMPATLASIRSMFCDTRQRMTAIGIWGAMWGGGAAVGPVLGGWLLEYFWWGSVFLVNVPIMLLLLATAPQVIPESRDPQPGRFDLVSAGLSIPAVLAVVYAIKELTTDGPSWRLAVLGVLGVVAGWVFVRRQRTLDDPLIDVRLFRVPSFSTAIVANALSVFALAGVLFFGSQFIQLVLGYRPLPTGLLMLPGTLASVVGSLLAAPLARWWGVRLALGVPLMATALGAVSMVGLSTDGRAVLYAAAFTLIGLGAGVALTLTSAMVVEAVEPERAGAASAVSETSYELGGAAGVAVLGSVLMAVFRGRLDTAALADGDAQAARETLGGAIATAERLDPGVGADLVRSAHEAFVTGIHVAATATAVLLLVTAILAMILLRPTRR
ncbi:MFS transporter [Pseudonocardia asaccharolytica]|uniref:MFS transporter n=1 Tax=Pseudonocardia asaccharolytica DSM 44247 = NBRC 16224 TaxID=1123024 RepID=A0A511D2L8_9PSEU|nr:MFS transporter [Pseudonocardia asaccharolytica]GEL18763.1 MFS transporter [Pseudonocardia asaccharolytica DSM 44247 = NBRC 16224]